MLKKWKRISSSVRLVGVLVIVALLTVVGYQLYDFYSERIGYTAPRAVEGYFSALATGDYEEVYRMTAKQDLTDIYGRKITEGEFADQLKGLTGGHKLPFTTIEVKKLFEGRGSRYYLVVLHSSVGGTTGQSRILVEVRREGKTWVVTYPFAIML
jgi:hypothetical protein